MSRQEIWSLRFGIGALLLFVGEFLMLPTADIVINMFNMQVRWLWPWLDGIRVTTECLRKSSRVNHVNKGPFDAHRTAFRELMRLLVQISRKCIRSIEGFWDSENPSTCIGKLRRR